MSPADALADEIESLEESINTAVRDLAETANDHAELLESQGATLIEHASKLEEHEGRLDAHKAAIDEQDARYNKLFDQVKDLLGFRFGATLDEHERALGDILRRLKALEVPPPAIAPKLPGKPRKDLEEKVRVLSPNWADVELYQREDGRIVIAGLLADEDALLAQVAKHAAIPKRRKEDAP